MSTELLEKGSVALTRFVGRCEACHPLKVGCCYQLTGPNGYVQLCEDCLVSMSVIVCDDALEAAIIPDRS